MGKHVSVSVHLKLICKTSQEVMNIEPFMKNTKKSMLFSHVICHVSMKFVSNIV